MAVTSCTLQRVQGNTTFDEKNRGHYALKYDVETNAITGHKALCNGAASSSPHPLPTWGATYSYQGDTDATAFAQNFSVESVEGHQFRYVVTVSFTPVNAEDPGSQFEPDPMDRPPVVYGDKEVFTRFVEKDSQGKQIVNKCNRPYDTPLEMEDVRGVVIVEMNVETLVEFFNYLRYLRFAVNSTSWTNPFGMTGVTIPPRMAVARDVSSTPPITEGDYTYYRLTFRFAFAMGDQTLGGTGDTWDVPILERGYQWRKAAFTPSGFEEDGNGQIRLFPPEGEVEPVLLASDGTKLPDGQPGVFTNWRAYREVDFNQLPF